MVFTGGPLACPNCALEIPVRDRYTWRMEGSPGEYKCPGCGHQFQGRGFVDLGTVGRASAKTIIGPLACPNCRMKIELHDRFAWRVAAGQYSCPGCGHHFPGRDFIDTATPINVFTMTERATELGRVGEALDWLNGENDRMVALERKFGVETRRIAEEIESHSRHRPLLYLCILVDTLADALKRLRAYAKSQGQEVRVVQSAAEIIETLAESTHVILDITAGLRWLPSKILLDAKWGDHLIFDEEGVMFAGQPGTAASDSTTFRSRAVPDRCYLHFFCDRPFNPPPWFAERLAGRVFDFRSSK